MSDNGAAPTVSTARIYTSVAILFLVIAIANVDRHAFAIVLDPIKHEFNLSDTMTGFLTSTAFALFYALFGIPVARIADTVNRAKVAGIAVGLWSIATALCGVAQSGLQLFLFRMTVGVGEAGAVPPSHSLIASYFSPERRALPFALMYLGAMLGSATVFGVGGHLAAEHGWRVMLIIVGLPGILIALLAWFFLVEKRPPAPFPKFSTMIAETRSVGRDLFANVAYRHLVIGYMFFGFISFGVFYWDIPFFTRTFGVPMETASKLYGLGTLISGVVGVTSGGFIGNFLAKRYGLKWLGIFPAICVTLSFPFFLGKYLLPDFYWSYVSMVIGQTVMIAFVGPFFSFLQAVLVDRERSTAVAINVFFANIIGYGAGPVIVGFLSDVFKPSYGDLSLKYGLLVTMIVLPWAAAHIYYASRHMKP